MYQEDLALNNPQWVICHEIKSNYTKYIYERTTTAISLARGG